MKKTMRFFSLVIAIFMICSLTTAAFATEIHEGEHNHTITINNSSANYGYTAYQIFVGSLGQDGVLANIQWGAGVDSDDLLAALKLEPAFASCQTALDVANVLSGNPATDNPTAVRFAEIAAAHVTTGTSSQWFENDKQHKIGVDHDGYYLVVNTVIPNPEEVDNTTVSRFILNVVRDVYVAHKGTFPTVSKVIKNEEGDKLSVSEASIGEAVNYEIVGTVPSNIADYNTYFYWFRDTLSKGLTYNPDSLQIIMDLDGSSTTTADSYDVKQYFAVYTSGGNGEDTKIHISINDLLALDNLSTVNGVITGHTKIIVRYNATLNEHAVIEGPNPNTVDLVYSNNPNVDGEPSTNPPEVPDIPTGEPEPEVPVGNTPDATVETHTTRLRIYKKDGQGNRLAGAEFQLTGQSVYTTIITKQVLTQVDENTPAEATKYYKLTDGTYTEADPIYVDNNPDDNINPVNTDSYVKDGNGEITKSWFLKEVEEIATATQNVNIKAFVGDDGYVTFSGLGAGEYTLTETTTPAGFNTIAPIHFEIEFDNATKTWSEETGSDVKRDEGALTFYTDVVNVKGNTLPSTGGIGTTIFYIFGGLMVAGAAVLLITKKRMSA